MSGLILLVFSLSSNAATTAKIQQILMFEAGNLMYVYPEGGVQNAPSCHGANGDYLSYDMSRPMAKEYLSLLMMAFAAQKTVVFSTAGSCDDQSISETILYISIKR